jgi:hypothetical protein
MSDLARVHGGLTPGNQMMRFDQSTYEVVGIDAPLQFDDDFIGGGHTAGVPAAGSPVAGYPWVKKIVGAAPPTVALVSNAAGGQIACALAATSEKEDAALYWNDNLSLDVGTQAAPKGLIYACRAALTVLPSAAGVQAVWGLQSAWIDGPYNAAEYIRFGATANGTILMTSYDGTTTNSISTGVTVVAGAFHNYRIDMSNPASIGFFIDGVQYNTPNQIGFNAAEPNTILQPYHSVYKASGTGVATLTLDAVNAFNFR